MRRLIPEGTAHVLVAFSGGADSTSLLDMLYEEARTTRLRVEAVHVNHGIRGAEADRDEAFVRAFCQERDIPLFVFHACLGTDASEDEARSARWRFFDRIMKETGADALVLAHHSEDVAETLLLNLMRGSGLDGLCAMKKETRRGAYCVLRPLLKETKDTLLQYLSQRHLSYCTDTTNASDAYLRNRIRHTLIPAMEAMIPGAGKHMADTAGLLEEEQRFVMRAAEKALRGAQGCFFPHHALRMIDRDLLPRVLRLWWGRCGGNLLEEHALSLDMTRRLSALVDAAPGSTENLPGDWHAFCGWQGLHLLPPDIRETPDLTWHMGEGAELGDGKRTQAMSRETALTLTVRTRRSGDFIVPFGMQGKKKLTDYLSDRHIDRPFRDRIPLACRGNEVMMVAGVGCGNLPRLAPGEEHILWTFDGPMPWMTDNEGKGKEL